MKMLSILPPDKTRTFSSSLCSSLIRTGVIGDGSCFFHCLYYAISPKYKNMTIPERITYIRSIRKQLADHLTLETVKSLGDSQMFKMIFLLFLRDILEKMSFKNWDHWDNVVLVNISKDWNSCNVKDLGDMLPPVMSWTSLLNSIEQKVLAQFKFKVEHDWIDDFTLEYVSRIYQRNLYFVKANDRLPYKVFQTHEYPTSIVFCWIDQSHYEIIGQLDNNLCPTREFTSNHSLIQSIQMESNKKSIEKRI